MASDSMYQDTQYYQMLHASRCHDLAFYKSMAQLGGGPILDCGIGAGRVAIVLAQEGSAVTGVDSSAAMLQTLEAQLRREPTDVRARVRGVLGDTRALELDQRFGTVLCPFNGIAHHHHLDELGAFLTNVRAHLADNGLFAFDTLVPDPRLLLGTSSEIPWFRHPKTGLACRCTEDIVYDPATQVLRITATIRHMEGDLPHEIRELRLRQLFPQETRLLLHHHGFEIERVDDLGDVLAYVCRAA